MQRRHLATLLRWSAMAWLSGCLAGAVVFAGEREPLRSGDAVPSGSFEDIAGDRTSTADYGGWVHVLTFADRESSEELKAWLSGAQIRATRAHPELRVAYLSFADLSSVPRLLRGMVRPILRKSFEHSNDDLAESYRKVGIEPDPEKVAFRFIPDWDGALLEVFGLRDATAYRCWIALDGVVVESLDAATADIAARYVAAFDRIAAERSAFAARVPRAGR